MKKFTAALAITVVALIAYMLGQSYGAVSIGPIAPAVSNCPAGASGQATLCPVGSGTTYAMYVSYNGGAYQLLSPSSVGVTSFNGRTGAVTSASGDYSYGQLSGLPTTTGACTGGSLTGTGTITATGSGSMAVTINGATLTGCPF